MPDIIQLLPDSVANQIAAGEVIQRPASVIKELVENAIDAGANSITILIKDAGRTLIQVIDNGKGMSETDARMAFERHATSKIRKADDLFAIRSMGFRGEALASMAAVAEVTLQTCRLEDELGTELTIRATEVVSQEPVSCVKGSNFSVKNLFFNIPARRKFLKTDSYEFRLIVNEIQRVALAFPSVEFKLQHNNTEILNLSPTIFRQRIVQLFGKNINQGLVDIRTNTSIIKISGLIGKPDIAKKSQGEQFFFVNNRYMRNPYFHKAILNAYDRILAIDVQPSYFICFEIEPANIDVNIHPTKTEIKFEDEQAIWQILNATVKEALGKFNVMPPLDFSSEAAFEIPVLSRATQIKMPTISVNPNFNPFDNETNNNNSGQNSSGDYFKRQNLSNWESLYSGFEREKTIEPSAVQTQSNLFGNSQEQAASHNLLQLKNKYILSPSKSGLMIIDQRKAHERILFEQFMVFIENSNGISQQTLFPQVIELSQTDHDLILEYLEQINSLGFDINDFGNNTLVVNGCPAIIDNPNPKFLIEEIITELHNSPLQGGVKVKEYIATVLAKASAIPQEKALNLSEMQDIIDRLFACTNHNFSPDGKPIVAIIGLDELEKRLR
jgi:DNA mismatch repair protein MutL